MVQILSLYYYTMKDIIFTMFEKHSSDKNCHTILKIFISITTMEDKGDLWSQLFLNFVFIFLVNND